MNTDTRVTVDIKDPSTYAMGCAASLNGKRGKVDRMSGDGTKVLVTFDEPAAKWWTNQTDPVRLLLVSGERIADRLTASLATSSESLMVT